MDVVCLVCRKTFYVIPYRVRRGVKYCSRECKDASQVGKKLSDETRKRMSEYRKNYPNRYWLNRTFPKRVREKMSKSHKDRPNSGQFKKGQVFSEEYKRKLSIAGRGRKKSKEHIRKILSCRPITRLELKMQDVIDKFSLPYKFVGNGSFFIGRFNPDFISTDGSKRAIEVYYKSHKEQFRSGGVKGWKRQRTKVFKSNGWNILFLEPYQINNDLAQVLTT